MSACAATATPTATTGTVTSAVVLNSQSVQVTTGVAAVGFNLALSCGGT